MSQNKAGKSTKDWESQPYRVNFVSGKGGVGKSVVAGALAQHYSESEKTLLAELGDHSFFQEVYGREISQKIGYEPSYRSGNNASEPKNSNKSDDPGRISENIMPFGPAISLWSGQLCLQEYARHLLKLESLYQLFFENALMRALIEIAPGLAELSIMGKITSGPRQYGPPHPFKQLVIDAPSTGHFLALLKAPEAMSQIIRRGPMGEQSRSIAETLKNPEICRYTLVCFPEAMPIQETIELFGQLKDLLGVLPQIVLNKCYFYDADLHSSTPIEILKQMADEFPALKSYAEFLTHQFKKESQAMSQLLQVTEQVIRLPYIFENETANVISKLNQSHSLQLQMLQEMGEKK